MKRKRKEIKYKKERAILSDVLPFEIPITFSNRHFYEFILENNIRYEGGRIFWAKKDDAFDNIIRLLFGVNGNAAIETKTEPFFAKDISISSFKKDKNNSSLQFLSIPFGYKISHKENEYRELAICHPKNQLQLIDFYNTHKEIILYYCRGESFSIRRPSKISKFVYHKDRTHFDNLTDEAVSIEEFDKEYENLRSFFVYKDYSNIYKFYESYKYHRAEKKYNKLIKLDISKCFDSIYTHSLSWALINKESAKEYLNESKKTFAGRFDTLMQNLNYNETNGIIIGPEFSRIFAELILQSVDQDVQQELEKNHQHYHKRDYEIFRYVDDYFIFYNDESVKDDILQSLQLKLKGYKLYLNSSKAITYEKPIITEISMAKHKIAKLIDEKLEYKIEKIEPIEEGGDDAIKVVEKKGIININSNALITQFKTIIKEYEVSYKDLLNYALSIIERKSIKIIKDYQSIIKNENSEKNLTRAVLEILDFTFFIYAVSPRVNTTIKLCRILRVYTEFLKRKGANRDFQHLVFKQIYDNICFILKKNKNCEHTQVETLYLLIALSELGKEYWLDSDALCSYFDIKLNNPSQKQNLNYLSITVLLFYIKNKNRYNALRLYLEEVIKGKFEDKKVTLQKDTELTLLLLDSISCPYIQESTKKGLLNFYGITDNLMQDKIIKFRPYWFTKWTDFDFGMELDAKKSQEVY